MSKRRIKTGCMVGVLLVLLLPVLYLLSLGPVAAFVHWYQDDTVLSVADAYAMPASLVVRSGYGSWIQAYIHWWTPG